MEQNYKQSTHSGSTDAQLPEGDTGWEIYLEGQLMKFGVSYLLDIFYETDKYRDCRFLTISDALMDARENPHEFVGISYPVDMPMVYETFHKKYKPTNPVHNSNYLILPMLSHYIIAIVYSKLWRLCETHAAIPGQERNLETMKEIRNICDLVVHASRISDSEYRAFSVRCLLDLKYPDDGEHNVFDMPEATSHKLNQRAQNLFSKWLTDIRPGWGSPEKAALRVCDTEAFPYDFLDCYLKVKAFDADHP